MQEDNRRLIDEAIESEPVKNTFRLAWEFLILNKKFTLTGMGIFVVLNVFASIPVVALFFVVFAAVFGVVMQMHIGRTFYGAEDIGTYVADIEKSRIDEVLSKHVSSASGVYLGWIALIILLLFIFGFIGAASGMFHEKMTEADVLVAFSKLGVPLIVTALLIAYVQPLVHSNIVLANNFKEGFKSVFTLFSKDVWSSAMSKSYFFYVVKVGLLLMVVLLSAVFTAEFLSTVPVVGLIVSIIVLALMYVFMMFMSVMSMMARRIVEE